MADNPHFEYEADPSKIQSPFANAATLNTDVSFMHRRQRE